MLAVEDVGVLVDGAAEAKVRVLKEPVTDRGRSVLGLAVQPEEQRHLASRIVGYDCRKGVEDVALVVGVEI